MGINREIERKLQSVEKTRAENIIELRNLKFRYIHSGPVVLDIEDLVIKRGEKVAIIGPSGAGKTTLLRMINGYIQPDSGYLKILGHKYSAKSVKPRNLSRRIGFIFQHFNLIDRATVFQNVLWGRLGLVNPFMSIFGWFREEDKQAAMKAIADVDLVQHADQRTDKLSGGQLQRVSIARVLAQEPEIILADEPVSNLDPALADDILNLLSELCQRYSVTLLMNLHQPALAKSYADRIIGLREGRVVYDKRAHLVDVNILHSIFDPEVNKTVLFGVKANTQLSQRKVIS